MPGEGPGVPPEDSEKPGLGVLWAGGALRGRWQGLPCSSPRDSAALLDHHLWLGGGGVKGEGGAQICSRSRPTLGLGPPGWW